ncbi:AMP-binding protein [Pseudomonas sp. JQ170]|uniref:class I adenylate-forming enzyme family protein n=1 Tax=unclassified Pseudomonas TaxID=196821 RepID=UPI002652C624|nr:MULTISPECIES: AMP-binding protein [unclassified Pseudomonas]MDN7141229.1 AMP-binding protein [Pseudomonas sp. JQ170]WRO78189.1 AMP-binding protein [Pseudomonas sp. 170C]
MTRLAMGKMVVGHVLSNAAIRFPERESFLCSSTERRFTFKQTNERCNRLANGLGELGLRKGDRVAFLSSNRAEMVEIYFALAKTGMVGLPLNYRLAPVEMLELMRAVGAVALIAERRFCDALVPLMPDLPQIAHCISFGEGTALGNDYEALLARSAVSEPQVEVEEDDPFYFNLTSGTTGLPKCYVINHYNCTAGNSLFPSYDLTRRDVAMTVFPMFGRVGFGWALATVQLGLRNVLVNFETQTVLRLIEEEGVTAVNLVPTMAAMLLASPHLEGTRLEALRVLVFAGSSLPESIRESVQTRLCPNVYEYYGMQESGALTLSTPEDRQRKPASAGRQVLYSNVRIVDAQGNDLPAGQPGEIYGRSPNAVTAYYDSPAKTAETFQGGWVHTGDIGYLDDEGYLFISGRLKEVIVTGGQNVHAAEIEELILTYPGVADCTVIGLPDPLWGEAVTAVVVPAGDPIDAAALITFCHARLAGFKTPKSVLQQSDALPRTPTGKVQKFRLVERYTSTTRTR